MSKRAQRHGQVKGCKGPIPEGIAVLGLDIGSQTHVGRFWAAPGQREAAQSFANTAAGARALLAWLDERTGGDRSQGVVGFEPTGSYWQGFVGRLVAAGVRVRVIAPQHTKKYKELFDNSPNQSDAKDAGVIAELTKRGHGLLLRLPQGAYADLRALNEGYHRATQRITAVQNQTREVAFGLFPELGVAIDPFSATGRALWAVTPTPAAWLAKRRSTRERLVRQASRGRLGAAWVAQLTEGARDSLGCTEAVAPRVAELAFLLAELDRWAARRAALEAELVATLDGCVEGAWLESRAEPGPSDGRADPGRDRSAGGLCEWPGGAQTRRAQPVCEGLRQAHARSSVLPHHQAGPFSPAARAVLCRAYRLVQRGGVFHGDYRRLVDDNGVVKVRALVAVMRKLLRVLTALARDHAAYDPISVPG